MVKFTPDLTSYWVTFQFCKKKVFFTFWWHFVKNSDQLLLKIISSANSTLLQCFPLSIHGLWLFMLLINFFNWNIHRVLVAVFQTNDNQFIVRNEKFAKSKCTSNKKSSVWNISLVCFGLLDTNPLKIREYEAIETHALREKRRLNIIQ